MADSILMNKCCGKTITLKYGYSVETFKCEDVSFIIEGDECVIEFIDNLGESHIVGINFSVETVE